MKNKILQKIKFIFIATNLLFVSSLIYADEFEITALKIELDNKDKKIFAKGDVVAKSNDGLIINAAGFTHTSVAIRDALAIFKKPSIELHISNIYKREEFRHKSMISDVVTGIICGLGTNGYILAINAMHELLKDGNR